MKIKMFNSNTENKQSTSWTQKEKDQITRLIKEIGQEIEHLSRALDEDKKEFGSFRDPSGPIFNQDDQPSRKSLELACTNHKIRKNTLQEILEGKLINQEAHQLLLKMPLLKECAIISNYKNFTTEIHGVHNFS